MAANNHRGGDAQLNFTRGFLKLMKSGVSERNLGVEDNFDPEQKAAVALQRAWRKRSAYVFVKDLKQEKLCRQQREEMRAGLHVECEACASAGKKSADIKSRNLKKAWKDADELLFKGMARLQMSDRGDNWNERWQEALALPNKTAMEVQCKRSSLDAVYSDFVHTAVTYGRTIISEYFLHEYMKSVKPKRLGGVAGGKKYLWRGILFKLADGSQGPYGGSDEAAAKAAGHELRGASEYLRTRVGLCVPPMCLLDYKGFRMLAQAHLPLGSSSLKMGTNDGGRTVLNDSPTLNRRTAEAGRALGLRAHIVGGRQAWVTYRDAATRAVYRMKRNVGGQLLHAAADVEGHEGADSRLYLLDLARAFPPEDPDATPHLSGMLSVSAKVVVQKEGEKAKAATVTKAHATLVDYDILYPDGTLEKATPAHMLRDLRLFIFYRLLRPEFVRDRGRKVLRLVKLPPGHKFPMVKVTNPMMFAITFARSATAKGNDRDKDKKAIKDKVAGPSSGYRQFYEAGPADGYDAADLDGGGGGDDDGDGDGYRDSLDDQGTKAVALPPNGAVTRSASGLGNGANDTSSETSGLGEEEETVDDYTGFDTSSESSSMFSVGVHMNSERMFRLTHAQNPSGAPLHPASSPAGIMAAKTPTGGGGGSRIAGCRANQMPAAAVAAAAQAFGPEGERGYDAFSIKSLNSQTSQDMAPGSPISNITRHTTTRGLDLESSEGQGRGTDGGVSGQDSMAPKAGAAAAAAAAAEPEVLLPSTGGGGYDPFSSKSLVSNGSCSSMSELSLQPRGITRGVGGGRGRAGLLHGGGGGDGDADDGDSVDGDTAPDDGYSAFQSSSQTGTGGGGGARAAHHRVKSASSSTEGTHGGGVGGSSGGSATATGGHRRQVSAAGMFGGVVDESAVVEVPAHKASKRRSSKAKLWPVADDEPNRVRGAAPPPAEAGDAGSDDGGDVDVGGGSGYDGFDPQPAGYDGFNDHDNDGALPPPRSLTGAPGYDSFHASKGSNRSIGSSLLSVAPPSPLPQPPPQQQQLQQQRAAVSSHPTSWSSSSSPPSSSPPRGRTKPKPPLERVAAAEGQKRAPSAGTSDRSGRGANGDAGSEKGYGGGHANGSGNGDRHGHRAGRRSNPPVPLSPDALTAFSNGDPEAKDRNREVTEATQFLLTVLVPATAKLLCAMSPKELSAINLSQKLHEYGVNMRHIGLLRAYVTPPNRGTASAPSPSQASAPASGSGSSSAASAATSKSGKTSAGIMRDRALVEVVVRTLKLVLRGFQRRWMKSEQSSSEQGMHLLVTQFLNLVTGSHTRSDIFWRENVTTGICQRFGTVALTESERAGLWTVCSDRTDLLLTIVKELVKVTGVRFKESINQKLRSKSAKSIIVGFKFNLNDIRDIEAVVTPMTIYQ
eukprot:g4078.t1